MPCYAESVLLRLLSQSSCDVAHCIRIQVSKRRADKHRCCQTFCCCLLSELVNYWLCRHHPVTPRTCLVACLEASVVTHKSCSLTGYYLASVHQVPSTCLGKTWLTWTTLTASRARALCLREHSNKCSQPSGNGAGQETMEFSRTGFGTAGGSFQLSWTVFTVHIAIFTLSCSGAFSNEFL